MWLLTLTLEPLLDDAPQQGAAVVAERRGHVRVDVEPMRNVDLETLTQVLKGQRKRNYEKRNMVKERGDNSYVRNGVNLVRSLLLKTS